MFNNNKNIIEKFEKLDQALLRGLLAGHYKVFIPALYFKISQMPIRCIIACRSILYLHRLLKRSPNELIKRVYLAQKDDPSDGDFCNLVASDLETLGLHRTKTQIKLLLKKQARKSTFDYLLNLKTEKSKMENLKYKTFHLQPYHRVIRSSYL